MEEFSPQCPDCKHFRMTYNRERPYQCTLFAFESNLYPEIAVFDETNMRCRKFEMRPDVKKVRDEAGQESFESRNSSFKVGV